MSVMIIMRMGYSDDLHKYKDENGGEASDSLPDSLL